MARLEEGRGKKGQMKQSMKRSSFSDEWGSNDDQRKRNKPGRFKVVKKAVWDD